MYIFLNIDLINNDAIDEFNFLHNIYFDITRKDIIPDYGDEAFKQADKLLSTIGTHCFSHGHEILASLDELIKQGYQLILTSNHSEDYLRLRWECLQKNFENVPDFMALVVHKDFLDVPSQSVCYGNGIRGISLKSPVTHESLEDVLSILPKTPIQPLVIEGSKSDGFQVLTRVPVEKNMLALMLTYLLNLLMKPFLYLFSWYFEGLNQKFDALIDQWTLSPPRFVALEP